MDGGLVRDIPDLCFWQIMDLDSLNNSDTFVYLEGNVAPVTGYAIYAGYTKDCIVRSASEEQKTSEELSNISRAIFFACFPFCISKYLAQLLVSSEFSGCYSLFLLSRTRAHM